MHLLVGSPFASGVLEDAAVLHRRRRRRRRRVRTFIIDMRRFVQRVGRGGGGGGVQCELLIIGVDQIST